MSSGGRTQSEASFHVSGAVSVLKPITALSKTITTPEASARRYRPARLAHVLYVSHGRRFTRVCDIRSGVKLNDGLISEKTTAHSLVPRIST